MLSVIFVLAATLTLLPAVLARLGTRVDKLSLPWVHSGEHRSPRFAAWGEWLWRHPWAPGIAHRRGPRRARRPGPLARHRHAVDQGRAAGRHQPPGLRARPAGSSAPAHPAPSRWSRPPPTAKARGGDARRRPGHRSGHPAAAGRVRRRRPDPGGARRRSVLERARRHDRPAPRATLPAGVAVGGAVAENHDLEAELAAKTPLVIGVVLGLGFLLLLIALQAPLIAALGVLTNLLATGAAFGVAQLIFQEGHASRVCSASSRRASSTRGARCSSSR